VFALVGLGQERDLDRRRPRVRERRAAVAVDFEGPAQNGQDSGVH
jgi:hypothetical protein